MTSSKYSHRAIQNGGRGTDGGRAGVPLAPPPLDPPHCDAITFKFQGGIGSLAPSADAHAVSHHPTEADRT